MEATLIVTDGTITIDMLNIPGFLLESWRPFIPAYKGGGTFQQSPLATGRQLVNKQFENYTETFSFKVQDVNANTTIRNMQEIRRLLEKASSYWSADFQNEPVWLEAKSKCETNTRYGLIVTGYIPDDENPFNQPFLQAGAESIMNDMTLIIEHQAWTENQPGTSTDVEISAVETYDGRNLGNVNSAGARDPTSSDETFVACKRNTANITDIYIDDGGAFSANLMDAGLPYNLLPAVPAVNDAVYFGIDTSLSDSGPFCSLVFDIGTGGTGYTTTGGWEYWNGAAWAQLAELDNTDTASITFGLTGVNTVCWEHPSDWATTAVNGITGYWVRLRVTATPGAPTAPTQQNRDIYSVVWPYIEIQEDQINGDISPLIRHLIHNQSDNLNSETFVPTSYANRVLVGLRTMDRGENFTAYLNCADEQNPTNIAVAVEGIGAFVNNVETPTGRCVQVTPAIAPAANFANIRITNTLTSEYHGSYHGFLRAAQTSGAPGDIVFSIEGNISGNGPVFYESDELTFSYTNEFQSFDLGKITVPRSVLNAYADFLEFVFDAYGNASSIMQVYDLILLPIDEWAIDAVDANKVSNARIGRRSSREGRFLDLDSILSPKDYVIALVKDFEFDRLEAQYLPITNNYVTLQANIKQRLWFIFTRNPDLATDEERMTPYSVFSIQTKKNAQYLSMRGDR